MRATDARRRLCASRFEGHSAFRAPSRAIRDVGSVMAGFHRVIGERFDYPAADFTTGGLLLPPKLA